MGIRRLVHLLAGAYMHSLRLTRSIAARRVKVASLGLTDIEIEVWNLGTIRGSPLHVLRVAMEASSPNYWNNVVVKGAVVIDVGGYIGDTALLFAMGGALRIYVFEPSVEYYNMAKRNLSSHSNILLYNQAIGSKNGVGHLSGKLMGKALSDSGGDIVYVRAFDEVVDEVLARESRIDLVKLDCEGSEGQIIMGSDPRIFKGIRSFWIEMHGDERERISLTKYLGMFGYTLVRRDPHYYIKDVLNSPAIPSPAWRIDSKLATPGNSDVAPGKAAHSAGLNAINTTAERVGRPRWYNKCSSIHANPTF